MSVMTSQIYQQLDGLYIILFKLTSKKTSKPVLQVLWDEKPPVTKGQ